MPIDAAYFTLEVNGRRVHQGLFDRAQVPPSELAAPPEAAEEEVPSVLPADEPQAPEVAAEDLGGEDDLWKSINLEKAEGVGEVELDRGDDDKQPL
jgi:hypothetical protein